MPVTDGYKKWNYVLQHGALPERTKIEYDPEDPILSRGGLRVNRENDFVAMMRAAILDEPSIMSTETINLAFSWVTDPFGKTDRRSVYSAASAQYTLDPSRFKDTSKWQKLKERLLQIAAMCADGHEVFVLHPSHYWSGAPDVYPWTKEFNELA